MPILELQKRYMELGRIRLGDERKPNAPGRPTGTFRFTSASQTLLEAIAARYGGTVKSWEAQDEGYFQVMTDASEIAAIMPPVYSSIDGEPTVPFSQWYEDWAGAACQRRCDGETELLSGKPCLCKVQVEAEGEDARTCKITTRFSVMLPDIPGLGVWRMESHGYNAAVELPGTIEILVRAAAEQAFLPIVLRIEHRTKRVADGPTKRFVVPVIDLPSMTLQQLASGNAPLVLNAPRQSPPKPSLPRVEPPVATLGVAQDTDSIPFGQPPDIQPVVVRLDGEGVEATNDPITPESLRSSLLEEELLAACAELDVNIDDVRKAIDDNAGDDAWLKRQVERARENLAIRQAEELTT